MGAKKLFLFIVEGSNREIKIFNNVISVFFNDKSDAVIIPVPAEMNVYMLYDSMKKDNFEIDVVELLKEKVPRARALLKDYFRDSFAEIYYFFDFDEHSNNLHNVNNIDALYEMLKKLDNETELGKLYISYPMIEALRDFDSADCGTANGKCFRNRNEFGTYKNDSSVNYEYNNICNYDFLSWKKVIGNYIYRTSCFFRFNELNRELFIEKVTPFHIFEKQMLGYSTTENVFILSCLPEFLIDYSENYWNAVVGKRKKLVRRKGCTEI